MSADHGHGHGHAVSAETDKRYLSGALALIVGFMAVEVVVGFIANSIALISDAAHMLTDASAIVLALAAMRIAARPPKGAYTFGWKRADGTRRPYWMMRPLKPSRETYKLRTED